MFFVLTIVIDKNEPLYTVEQSLWSIDQRASRAVVSFGKTSYVLWVWYDHVEREGVYDLNCCPPPEGDQDVLASLDWSSKAMLGLYTVDEHFKLDANS